MFAGMDNFASNLIATLGGSTAVARMAAAPVSTVHSWKHNGIPSSRLAHLRLIAEKEAIGVDWDTGRPEKAEPAPSSSEDDKPEWPIGSANNGGEIITTGGEAGHGAPFAQETSAKAAPHAPSPLRSSPTCSETSALPPPSPGSRACSAGKADAA